MVELPYSKEKITNSNTIAIEFSSNYIKCFVIKNNKKITDNPVSIKNILYYISQKKSLSLKKDTADMVNIRSGYFTKNEIENAQLLLQAEEVPVNIEIAEQVQKAYQNFLERLPQIFSTFTLNDTELDTWLVLLSLPFIQDESTYKNMLQIHMVALKAIGLVKVALLDHLSASFFSQRQKIYQENPKKPHGLLINIGPNAQIGVLISKLQADSFVETQGLGINTIIDHAIAILNDFRIHGFKPATLEQWLTESGTCDGSAPVTLKHIRRKEFNIQPILNAPMLLFDYKKVTKKQNNYNSIVEGVVQALNASKKVKKNVDKLLNTIVITGQGARYKGLQQVFKNQLQTLFPNKTIRITIGQDPENAVINGLQEIIYLNPEITAYNILVERSDPNEFKHQQKIYQKEINDILKQIKATDKKLIHPDTLNALTKSLLGSLSALAKIPKELHPYISQQLTEQTKNWSKEYNKALKEYKKEAEHGLKEIKDIMVKFRVYSSSIDQLPKFLRASFTHVLSSNISEIKKIELKHNEILDSTNLKKIHKIIKSHFHNISHFQVEDLAKASDIGLDMVLDLVPSILTKYPDLGFLDGRIVQFQEKYLTNVGQFLNTLRDDFYSAIETDKTAANELLGQINEYCDFLIRGYESFQQKDVANRFRAEKSFLQNELQNVE